MVLHSRMANLPGRPADIVLESLKSEAILTPEGVEHSFNLGSFSFADSSEDVVAVAIIACVQDRFLVAFPGSVWNRRVDKRKLPAGCLEKPISLSVPGCSAESREDPIPDSSIHLWVGWLKKEFLGKVDFTSPSGHTFEFIDRDSEEACYPFASALVSVAEEKFQVSNQPMEAVGHDRLASLEDKFARLQAGLDHLLQVHEARDGGFATGEENPPAPSLQARPKHSPAALPKGHLAAPPGLGVLHSVPGLDPGTVAAALQAGIPRSQLEVMSGVLQQGSDRLGDYPRINMAPEAMDLDGDPDVLDLDNPGPRSNDPMADAVLKLTQIVTKLTRSGQSGNTLEDALDQVGSGGGSGSGDVSSSMGRKHAAARRALTKAFNEDPAQIWKSVEANMAQDFSLQSSMPNASTAFTARGWCEHRSKIQPYVRTCRWVWGIAGILDNLRQGQVDQARARAGLLLAAAEQESLDHGSFLLSQEFLMEPAVPISSFQNHALPDAVEMATTRLLDPRWIEAFADRLKQLDTYVEMRKKLNLRSKAPQPAAQPAKAGAKGKGKSQKGKSKDREGEAETAQA